MKQELEQQLQKKYPKILKDLYDDMHTTCMAWGISCGDGWYFILDNLMNSIQSHIDNNSTKIRIKNKYARKFIELIYKFKKILNKSKIKLIRKFNFDILSYKLIYKFKNKFEEETYETIPQVVAEQIKEKFGGLRFYYYGGDQKIAGMVRLAEILADNTCEICGSTENVGKTTGWITTICEKCYSTDEHFKTKQWEKNE